MKLRAYLLDDEELAIKRLTRLLNATGRVEVAGQSTDPEEALRAVPSLRPDVIFLDIQMPGLNGFEFLARLASPPPVVFTTAYDQYALKAFDVNSVDYLLKPVEAQKLERALKKLETPSTLSRELVEHLAGALHHPYPERIASRVGTRIQFLELQSVTHFFAKDKLTFAASGGKNYVVDETITQLEQRLDPHKFVRIHRATLVNLTQIKELDTWFGGGLVVRLKDGTELQASRDRVRVLKAKLGVGGAPK